MNQSGEPSPFFGANTNGDFNLKMPHDRYEVYVNGDFVGHKVLLTQSESIDDVAKYLQRNGYKQFSATLDGDHYNIETNSSQDDDTHDAEQMKNRLGVYLDLR